MSTAIDAILMAPKLDAVILMAAKPNVVILMAAKPNVVILMAAKRPEDLLFTPSGSRIIRVAVW